MAILANELRSAIDVEAKPLVKLPKRFQWNISGECRIQLVETIPETLISHHYAQEMPVEHMSTMEVCFNEFAIYKQ